MKILYTSAVCSVRLLDWLYKTSVKKPMYSIQKFHRLLLKGFVANHIDVQTLTTIYGLSYMLFSIQWYGALTIAKRKD